jgi:hypothetical protein
VLEIFACSSQAATRGSIELLTETRNTKNQTRSLVFSILLQLIDRFRTYDWVKVGQNLNSSNLLAYLDEKTSASFH